MFSVDVSDDRGNRKMFKMQKNEGVWNILADDQLPDWIWKNEAIFKELIEEELKLNGL
jgi:hypothetical protein